MTHIARTHSARRYPANRLLASLPKADREMLEAASRVEHPHHGEVIAAQGKPDEEVWFPHDAVVALSTTDDDGRSAQTAVVGTEGCVGVGALLPDAPTLADASVQVEGDMSVVPARAVQSAIKSRPIIRQALLKYLYRLTAESLRVAACNRLHPLERRCCTWLLMIQDRTGLSELPLTQEGLSTLLGGGRPRINQTLGSLERRGLIRRKRGRILLLSRHGLEERACDCYGAVFRL